MTRRLLRALLMTTLVALAACASATVTAEDAPANLVASLAHAGWILTPVAADARSDWAGPDDAVTRVKQLLGSGYDLGHVYAGLLQPSDASGGAAASGKPVYAVAMLAFPDHNYDVLILVDARHPDLDPIARYFAFQLAELGGSSAPSPPTPSPTN